MNDIFSQGGDRQPSPWLPHLVVIAPLIVVIVGVAIYLSLARHQHAPVTHPAHATASPAPVPTGQP